MKALSKVFNPTAAYVGSALGWIPIISHALYEFTEAGAIAANPFEIWHSVPIAAVGIGLSIAGYNRAFSGHNEQHLKRGSLSHTFNYLMTATGATVAMSASAVGWVDLMDKTISLPQEQALITLAAFIGASAMFGAGYNRVIGMTKSAPPKP